MKVNEIVGIMDENKSVSVYNPIGEKISCYDGRNSIDEKYMDADIMRISVLSDCIVMIIKAEVK